MEKIKTALLSYGMSGKVFHAPFLTSHGGFELTGAWERSQKLIHNDYPEVKSYPSLETLLADDVDLVIINTPVETHFEYAKKALLAGKHIIVEKAFTTTSAEARELGEIAKSKKLKLAVFQNRRWDSDFRTVQNIYSKNLLGELVEAEFHFDRYNPNLSPKKHKETTNSGAGILKDLGPHIIDQALLLFGFPDAVFADVRITRENSVVDDYFDILMYYKSYRVRLKASFFVREMVPSYILHGKKGSFLKHRGDIQEDALKLGQKPTSKDWGKEPISKQGILHTQTNVTVIQEHVSTLDGNYMFFFEGVYNSIKNNEPEPVTAEDGYKTMRIIEAAMQSGKAKKVIEL